MNTSSYKWFDLNLFEIRSMRDNDKKTTFLKLRKECIKDLILPLLVNLPLHSGFKFSNTNDYLSCKEMSKELFCEYHKREYSKQEVMDIVNGKRVKKH